MPSSVGRLKPYLGLAHEKDKHSVIPPFLYPPGLALLLVVLLQLTLHLKPPWGLALLSVVELYAAGTAVLLLRSSERPGTEPDEIHEYWRVRTILWGMLAMALGGLVLTVFRAEPALPANLVPPVQVPTTEISVLAFTIAILAILSRYTVVTTRASDATTARTLDHIANSLDQGFQVLASRLEAIATAGQRTGEEEALRREGHLLVLPHVEKSGWLFRSLMLDVRAGAAGIASARLDVTLRRTGLPPSQLSSFSLGETSPAGGTTEDLGDVGKFGASAEIVVHGRWTSQTGIVYEGETAFRLLREGLFRFRTVPAFEFRLEGRAQRSG